MRSLLISLVAFIGLVGCRTPGSESTVREDVEPTDGEKKLLIDLVTNASGLTRVCNVAAHFTNPDKPWACDAAIIRATCASAIRVIGGAAKVGISSDPKAVDALRPIPIGFREAVVGCIRAAAIDQVKAVAGSVAAGAATKLSWQRNFIQELARTACIGGSKVIGDRIAKTRTVDFENACQAAKQAPWVSRERIASCFRSAGDICVAATLNGVVNLANFVPDTESEAQKLLLEVGSAGLSGLCQVGSVATGKACSVISVAAKQIKLALMTGNNDWAHCVGTTQIGACIGSKLGHDGWTNNNGIATAETTTDPKTGTTTTNRACCQCTREFYQNDGWFTDTMYHSDTFRGAIQKGDFASGNCGHLEGRIAYQSLTRNGYDAYIKYHSCRRITVRGNSCALNPD